MFTERTDLEKKLDKLAEHQAQAQALELLRADCDRLTEENERLKTQLEHQTKRTQHYVDQNMGLINAVAVLGNRISP